MALEITGRIVELRTQRGLPKLWVEAWHADRALGRSPAPTDAEGRFAIGLEEVVFGELTGQLTLMLKVLRADSAGPQVVKEQSTSWERGQDQIQMTIEVELAPAEGPDMTHEFVGQLLRAESGAPLAGLTVRAFALDAGAEPEDLGFVISDEQGVFTIPFNALVGGTRRLRLSLLDSLSNPLQELELDAGAGQAELEQIRISLGAEPELPQLQQIAELAHLSLPPELTRQLDEIVIPELGIHGIRTLEDVRRAGGIGQIVGLPLPNTHEAVRLLEAYADLGLLSAEVQVNTRLIELGYTSPAEIARTPRDRFVAHASAVLGAQDSEQIHSAALVQSRLLNHAAAEHIIPSGAGRPTFTLPQASRACECKDCQSAVSPGAYLTDLIDYALTHLQFFWPGFPQPEPMNLAYLVDLLHQPLDKLPASCEAAQEQVRQVRLSIEVLRRYLSGQTDLLSNNPAPYPIRFAFAGDVDGDGRDEVIVAPDWTATATAAMGPESSALWVMAYDPAAKLWRHLSPIVGHPYQADVVCGPYPYAVKFGFAADVDGDGRDELVLAIVKEGERTNELWVMEYDPAAKQWRHLSMIPNHPFSADIDPSSADVAARYALAADVDGDDRDEIIIALDRSGAEGRLFWVMDYDPAAGQWRHLSPISNHPLNADLDAEPGAPQSLIEAAFVIAGDFNGDGRDELAINAVLPNIDLSSTEFWVTYFDTASGAWERVLNPFSSSGTMAFWIEDSSGRSLPARYGTAADADGDGRDELIIGVQPFPQGDPNTLWVMDYAFDAAQQNWAWSQIQRRPNDSSGASINCAGPATHAQAAFAMNIDGSAPAEIAVLPIFERSSPDRNPKNGLWVMRFDSAAGQWVHRSQLPNHPIEADLDWSKATYPAEGAFPADVDGDGLDELVIYPAPRASLWVMEYDPGTNGWVHVSSQASLEQADRQYLLAAYRMLLSQLGTSYDELRLAPLEAEERQALAERLGIELGSTKPDNLSVLLLDPQTLNEQQLETLFGLVDTARDPYETVPEPKVRQWRLARLQTIWQEQDGLTDEYARRELPVIDPDLIGPDDFRDFAPAVAGSPAALWRKRRQWVDGQLDAFHGKKVAVQIAGKNLEIPDVDAMLEALRQDQIGYDGEQQIVWSQLGALSDLDTLLEELTEKDKTTVAEARERIEDQLHLSADSFLRLMAVRESVQAWRGGRAAEPPTAADWEDVYSILAQAMKVAFFPAWIDEEAAWESPLNQPPKQLLSPRQFWAPLRELIEGAWPSALVGPYIDPERVGLSDLPDSAVGAPALELWSKRKEALKKLRLALQQAYATAGLEALLAAAFGPPSTPTWWEKLKSLKDDLDSATPARSDPAQAFIEQQLKLSLDQFQRLITLKARLDANREPTKLEWNGVYDLLTSAQKQRTLYPMWQTEETNAGLEYWQALKARRPRWRATPEARQLWLQALGERSQQPIVDPDLITVAHLRAAAATAAQLYTDRRSALATRRAALASQPRTLAGVNQMLLLEDSVGVTGDELARLIKQRDDGESTAGRLNQLSITTNAFTLLARVYRLLANNAPVLDDEWEAVFDILTQVWKRRQFADWRAEETAAKLVLGPDAFQFPARDPSIFPPPPPPELPPWRATRQALRDWGDRLQVRSDQKAAMEEGLRTMLAEVEEATLPLLRDALVMASNAPAATLREKAKWLSERLLIDMQTDGRLMTTRVAQALETLQALLWSARTGQLAGPHVFFSAPNFDEEWKWIGSYASWRAAMFVYLYPENLLQPSLRRWQTPAFRAFTKELRTNQRFTPSRACELARAYANYWRDVCTLDLKVCANALTRVFIERRGTKQPSSRNLLHLFALSPTSGKVYWSTRDASGEPGYQQSYWTELEGLTAVSELIGAAVYRTPSFSMYLYLFAKTRADDGYQLVFVKYDLEQLSWDNTPTALELPEKAFQFEAKLRTPGVNTRPYLGITLPNGAIYSRSLNVAGTEWESDDFQPIFMQVRPVSWTDVFPITGGFQDNSGLADVTVTDLNGNGRPDLIFMFGERGGLITPAHYVIGRDIATNGAIAAGGWQQRDIPLQGGGPATGIAAGRINNNSIPDVIFFWAINSSALLQQAFGAVYCIAWDMNASGNTQLSGLCHVPLPGSIKNKDVHGSSIAVADISGSGKADLIIFFIVKSEPENKAYYIIGWDLQPDGRVRSWTEQAREVPGWFGTSNQGAGIAIADINGSGRPDLIVFHIDNPEGENQGYYRIGWSLDSEGKAKQWSDVHQITGWFGAETAGGGVAVADLDGNGLPELIVYHIDNRSGNNAGYYRVGWNLDGEWNQPWSAPCPVPVANYKPIYNGSYEITEQLSDGLLQLHRSEVQDAFQKNQALDADYRGAHLSYLEEAFYYVPLSIALQLQRSGEYLAALDWFRTVYDYTAPLDERKIYYGLKLEEQLQAPDYPERAENWLLDPLNPHLIASVRRNTYTRFTLLALVRCLLDYADAEYTRDTGESISRARLLYTTALDLLDTPELTQTKGSCEAYIALIQQSFDFWHEEAIQQLPLRDHLLAELHAVGSQPMLEAVLNEARAAQAQRLPWEELFLRLQKLLVRKRAEMADQPTRTFAELVMERPRQIEQAQRAMLARATSKDGATLRSRMLSNRALRTQPRLYLLAWVPTLTYEFCVVPNPVLAGLRLSAELNLHKIRTSRNIAGMERQLELYAAPTDTQSGMPTIGAGGQLILPGTTTLRPTPYRYAMLIERAKQLVGLAQQVESTFLSALQQRDQEAYTLLKARQEVALARAGVQLQELRVKEAEAGVKLARLQKERSQVQLDTYSEWIDTDLLPAELNLIRLYGWLALTQSVSAQAELRIRINETAKTGGDLAPLFEMAAANIAGNILQANINVSSFYVSHERRKQEWELQKKLAQHDLLIGDQQIALVEDRVRVTGQERAIAETQVEHAEATVDFLNNKFTGVELYEWMSGVLEGVYRFFLQQATSMARLASDQLAFERHETPPPFIQSDYWQPPSEQGGDGTGAGPDRRGLTGSARLLQDIYQLDQYAFETNQRKLQLSKTISLAQLAPVEFQRFREGGVLTFASSMSMFDRDFPGHYLRLIHKVRVTLIALIPPAQGIRATLTSGGVSRVVIGGDIYQTTIVRRDPQIIALSSPSNTTGLFELDPQSDMLAPFEGLGVDTTWELRMPKAANPFDYNTIADVLFTIEYTAFNSFDYRQQVVQQLDTRLSVERPFSFRSHFADQWYDLHNPELLDESQQMVAKFRIFREDLPPNLVNPKIQAVMLYFVCKEEVELPTVELYFTQEGSKGRAGGPFNPAQRLVSSRRGSNGGFATIIGKKGAGEWELVLPNTEAVRNLFKEGQIEDILLAITSIGETPPWPK